MFGFWSNIIPYLPHWMYQCWGIITPGLFGRVFPWIERNVRMMYLCRSVSLLGKNASLRLVLWMWSRHSQTTRLEAQQWLRNRVTLPPRRPVLLTTHTSQKWCHFQGCGSTRHYSWPWPSLLQIHLLANYFSNFVFVVV